MPVLTVTATVEPELDNFKRAKSGRCQVALL